VQALAQRMQAGDILIDGGNSISKMTFVVPLSFKEKGIHYVDVGTSGGRLGSGARLLHDDRRTERSCAATRSDFQSACSRSW